MCDKTNSTEAFSLIISWKRYPVLWTWIRMTKLHITPYSVGNLTYSKTNFTGNPFKNRLVGNKMCSQQHVCAHVSPFHMNSIWTHCIRLKPHRLLGCSRTGGVIMPGWSLDYWATSHQRISFHISLTAIISENEVFPIECSSIIV